MQWATDFHSNRSRDGPVNTSASENAKFYIFEIPPQIQFYFSLISKGQKHEMCLRNHFQSFNIRLSPSICS